MEISNNKTENQGSKEEGENQRDDEPTTSKVDNIPERNAHNMNDLKSLDFNSADEVRQAMKAFLSGQKPPPPEPISEDANNKIKFQNKSEPIGKQHAVNYTRINSELRINDERQVQENINLKDKTTAQIFTGDRFQLSGVSLDLNSRKLMTAGPSRLRRKSRKSPYIGKLSNVVQFKRRRWASETGSDADSEIFY